MMDIVKMMVTDGYYPCIRAIDINSKTWSIISRVANGSFSSVKNTPLSIVFGANFVYLLSLFFALAMCPA